jgi:hypothetical protein
MQEDDPNKGKIPDFRWIRRRLRRGGWRWQYSEEMLHKHQWLNRRRERPGWHHGAKTRNWTPEHAALLFG